MSQQPKPTSGAPRPRPDGAPPRPRRRRRGGRKALAAVAYVIFVIGISVLLAGGGWVLANDVLALNKPEHSAVLTITESDSFNDVVDQLAANDMIQYKWLFKLFSGVTKAKGKIAPGTYTLNTEMDYRAIITNISASSATRQEISVLIPEGYTVAQIFQLLESKGVSTAEKLNETASTHNYKFSFLLDLPLGEPTRLEGYLFPDTYKFYAGENPLYVINKMLVNFDAKVTDAMREKIAEMGYTVHEMITIASLIEKETTGDDQTTISSVIYNRLNSNYTLLEIDATVQYALPERKERLTYADLEIDSPYNTYRYPGLPPGPIANPGMASIRAAMNPKDTAWHFYALGKDGAHHFFKTHAEQQNFLQNDK